jgi:CheY-like chemotaxis protein
MELAPDLVELDMAMAGMSGIEVAKELRAGAAKTKLYGCLIVRDLLECAA